LSSIFLIIPAFNEQDSISEVVSEVPSIVEEIIVIDNGSTDLTAEMAAKAGAKVLSEEKRGYGHACLRGINYALDKGAGIIVFMDGDGSDDSNELQKLVEPIFARDIDFVVGSRLTGEMAPGSMTYPQKFGNKLAAYLMKKIFKGNFTDLGPFRAIKAKHVQRLQLREMTYGWTVDMQVQVLKHGLSYEEVPVSYRPRVKGKSKVSGTVKGTVLAGFMIIKTIIRAAIK